MDLSFLVNSDDLKKKKNEIKRIFMYRICGTGMGAAAVLLKEKGLHVEGGDIKFYPPMGDYLKSTGIPLHDLTQLNEEYYKQFDLIVVGNVVGGKSSEARMIESLGVPFASFPSALGALFLSDVNVVGIAGTHGKTTTTYLFTQVFENLGTNPGYLIGGVIDDRASSKAGDGKYFFIESDEYDSAYFEKISKFRLYQINCLVLTSLEFDHGDIFKDLEAIKDQFRMGIKDIPGPFIFCEDYQAALDLRSEFLESKGKNNWHTYGANSSIGPKILQLDEKGSRFILMLNGKMEEFKTSLVGEHNILNLSTVILYAGLQGFKPDEIQKAVTNLSLVKRRQEFRGFYRGSIVIDDFAHHPRAVELTIDSVKLKYPTKKLVAILEPNSATARSDFFQKDFPASLLKADSIVLARPSTSTTILGAKNLDCHLMAQDLRQQGKEAQVVTDLSSLRAVLDDLVKEDKVLLIMSNGTCLGLWESSFVNELKSVWPCGG